MKARHERPITTARVFETVTYGALDWPLKTVRLQRDSLEGYCQRITSSRISPGETYHEHSKLFASMLGELLATRTDADSLRREFLRRRSTAASRFWPAGSDAGLGELLAATVNSCGVELFYAIELRVFARNAVAFHEPLSDHFYLTSDVTASDAQQLRCALDISSVHVIESASPILFVMGNFARNDLLYGPRGYRRTLLEAGRVSQEILRHAAEAGLRARLLVDFFDRAVDAVLESDGTEEGTLVAIELESQNVR